jgi:protein SCO1/2
LSRARTLFAAACLLVAAVLAVTTLVAVRMRPAAAPVAAPVTSSGMAAIGGPFHLVDQNGRPVDQSLLKGKWTAIFFGYTFCPDVCPTNLQTLAVAEDRLGPKARDLQVVFVSIDPERDTPEALAAYLKSSGFPKGAIGLTGTPEEVAQAAKAYKVYYARSGKGPNYLMDHSTMTYLMNPQGVFVKVLPFRLSPDQVAKQISDAMDGKA